jgi:2-desacetyl-2-hydroxyethyl bacteriochlorophyllide A dehydrogenase
MSQTMRYPGRARTLRRTIRYLQLAPGDAVLAEGPPPELSPGDARVRVLACGICGTDVHALRGMVLPKGARYPIRPGHEVAGIVEEVDNGTTGVSVGELVALHPIAPCGECAACLAGDDYHCENGRALGFNAPGGMAEEVVWPADRMIGVNGLAAAEAALLPDAVATAYRALVAAQLPAGGSLCVIGPGGVGTHVLALARALDPEARLAAVVRSRAAAERVGSLGAEAIHGLRDAGRRVKRSLGPVDAVVDFSAARGAPREGVRMLRRGGRLVLGGVRDEPLSLGTTMTGIVSRELTVVGVFASSMDDLRAVASLADRLNLGESVSRRFPLTAAVEAIRLAAHHPSGSIVRVMIEPNGRHP